MLSRLLQFSNTAYPIFVTPSGITILVKLLQLLNAPLSNPVRTPYKIAT